MYVRRRWFLASTQEPHLITVTEASWTPRGTEYAYRAACSCNGYASKWLQYGGYAESAAMYHFRAMMPVAPVLPSPYPDDLELCMAGTHGHRKFNDCASEALYDMSMDGTETSTGDSDWGTSVHLMLNVAAESVTVDSGEFLIPAGHYVLTTDSQGFVSTVWFALAAEAQQEFDRLEALYVRFLDTLDEGTD